MKHPQVTKQELRQHLFKQRKSFAANSAQTTAIHRNIIPNLESTKYIHSYIPLPGEVDIWQSLHYLMAQQKRIFVPKILLGIQMRDLLLNDYQQLVSGKFGVCYPFPQIEYWGSYDAILVPGLGFDRSGNRIGFGPGYYDRFLSRHKSALLIGICYHWQLLDMIPSQFHDISMDMIVTEEEVISFE